MHTWCSIQPFLLLFYNLLWFIFWPYETSLEVVLVSLCSLTSHRVPMPQQKLLDNTYQHERREDRRHFWSSSWWKFWNLWFFSAFRTPRYQSFCKSALSSLLLGENLLHSIADGLCSTIYLAYLGTCHLVITTGKESMPLSTRPLHLEKNVRPGNCKISQAPMRSLLHWHHPPTDFIQ